MMLVVDDGTHRSVVGHVVTASTMRTVGSAGRFTPIDRSRTPT